MSERVVVTGMGAVTPLGSDFPALGGNSWREKPRRLRTLFDVAGCRCKQAATCALPDFARLHAKMLARLSRASRLALAAAREALADAQLLDSHGRSSLLPLPLSQHHGRRNGVGGTILRSMLAQHRGPGQFYRASRYQAQHQTHDLPASILAFAGRDDHRQCLRQRGQRHRPRRGPDPIRVCTTVCWPGGYEALTELIYVGFDCLQAMSPDCCPAVRCGP